MNILLTGGSGMIGMNIKNSFLSGRHTIFAPSHVELDITKPILQYVKDHKIDAIIHAATSPGYKIVGNPTLYENDMDMALNVFECAGVVDRIIIFSSGAACGDYTEKHSESLSYLFNPSTSYGRVKRDIEELSYQYPNCIVLRLFGVYGPYEDSNSRFISNMILRSLLGLDLIIKQNRKFDYIWVYDLLGIIDHFIEHDFKFHVVNVTPDKSEYLTDIACLVVDSDTIIKNIIIEDIRIGKEYSGASDRLRQEIPGLELTSLRDGVRKLKNYCRDNVEAFTNFLVAEGK